MAIVKRARYSFLAVSTWNRPRTRTGGTVQPKKILLITGAGVGVPLGLPTTTGFDIGSGAKYITKALQAYYDSQSDGGRSNDIEWILAGLERFTTHSDFTLHLLPHLMHPQSRTKSEAYAKTKFGELREAAKQELNRLKKLMYEKLDRFDEQVAADLYTGLLKRVQDVFGPCTFSVVTTNYDLTFEKATHYADRKLGNLGITGIESCFPSTDPRGPATYDARLDFGWEPGVLEYLKVHGSLDWHRDWDGNCTRSWSIIAPDKADDMLILYPGFKGVPAREPFRSLHGRLARRLLEADIVMIVGFACRDDYINALLENAMRHRPNRPILYMNPASIDEHPAESKARDFVQDFPEAFKHHPVELESTNAPGWEFVKALHGAASRFGIAKVST